MGDSIGERLREAREAKAKRTGRKVTQRAVANHLGLNEATFRSYEYDKAAPPEMLVKKVAAFLGVDDWRWFYEGDSEVGSPMTPAPLLDIPIPFIGEIGASDPVDWTDPFEAEEMEEVPPKMAGPGRFCCRVKGDSCYPLVHPRDLVVFQAESQPKLNMMILHRSTDKKATIKQLKHTGEHFILHPLNPTYKDIQATGTLVGFLVGIVRDENGEEITRYNPKGIYPS